MILEPYLMFDFWVDHRKFKEHILISTSISLKAIVSQTKGLFNTMTGTALVEVIEYINHWFLLIKSDNLNVYLRDIFWHWLSNYKP